jgi:TonB family protein
MTASVSITLLLALHAPPSPSPAVRASSGGTLPSLVSSDDYPVEAMRNDEQGQVAVSLAIGTDGRVSACTVTGSSGSAILDRKTCALLQERARFSPARNAKGKAVPDTVTHTITWRIDQRPLDPAVNRAWMPYYLCATGAATALFGGSTSNEAVAEQAMAQCPEQERALRAAIAQAEPGTAPATLDAIRRVVRGGVADAIQTMRLFGTRAKTDPPTGNLASLISEADYPGAALRNEEQGKVGVRLAVDTMGRVSSCTVVEPSGSASLDSATCTLLKVRARFIPARDAKGTPVTDTFVQRINWKITDGGDTPVDGMPPALQQWIRCLGAEAHRLAPAGGAADAVADRAFSACTADERAAAEALGQPSAAGGAPVLPPGLHDNVRRTIIEMVQGLRTSSGG